MSRCKAKPIRLIDMFNILHERDMVVVLFKNETRSRCTDMVKKLRVELDRYLGCTVEGLIGGNGIILLIND